MKKLSALSLIVFIVSCNPAVDVFQQYANSIEPVKLGDGSLSLDSVQWNNIFVSKTRELYFTKMGKSASIIYKMDYKDGTFQDLQKLNFLEGSPHSDVYVNAEADLMLFSSLMQEHENDSISDWNIWKSIRVRDKWESPEPFFETNLEGNQFYPWLTKSGNLYFAITPHGSSNSDLFVSKFVNGKYLNPEVLSSQINSKNLEGDAFIAPDESYLIFAGFDRPQNLGKSDLFISFYTNGKWSLPLWLGEKINSEGYDGSPFVTHDEKYLIFTSSRGSSDENTFFNHYIIPFHPVDYKNQ